MTTRLGRAAGAVIGVILALFAVGCDSVSLPHMSLPNNQPVQTRTFREPPETMYAATRAALEAMNYTFVRGNRGSGKLEMASRVLPGSALLVRQRQVEIQIEETVDGDSDVHITIWETSEDESAGGTRTATNRKVRDETAYEPLWARLDQQLRAMPSAE